MPIPLPVIPNVYRCTLNWRSSNGQQAANVIHLEKAGSNAAAVFADLDANVNTNMWKIVSGDAKVQSVDIIKLDGTSGRITFGTGAPLKWTGNGNTGDMIPASAVIVKFGTGLRGQANRGRIYLPFVAEGQQSSGTLDAAGVTAAQAQWNTFLAAMTVATTFLVVAAYDRIHNGAGAHATIVNSCTFESVAGTQRRRQQRLR